MAISFFLLFAIGLSIYFDRRKKPLVPWSLKKVGLRLLQGIIIVGLICLFFASCSKKGTDCRLCRTTYEYNSMIYPSFRTWTDSAIICDINFQDYERANTYFKMDSSKVVWESLKVTTICHGKR